MRIHESIMNILYNKKVSNKIKIKCIELINCYRLVPANYEYKEVREAIYALGEFQEIASAV